ncbi:MAG TPA: glycosyltransferase family 4 protein [Pyrinomonadaceae bacterium]|nr:glycosyltransferase family 4 protein [Pyrinomonadaceae bacterium]
MERHLKILLVGDYANDPRLGSAKVLLKLRDGFEKLGHECRVLFSEELGVSVSNNRLSQLMRPFAAARAISKVFRDHGSFDVVDVASAEGLVFGLAKLVGRFRNTAFITRSNGLEHLNYQRMLDDHRAGLLKKPWTRRIWYPATRLIQLAVSARLADRLILLNEDDRNYALRKRWLPSDRISIVPHGISECFLRDDPSESSGRGAGLLFCGTWDHSKGIHYLVEAFSLVRERGVKANLTVLGPGYPKEVVLRAFPKHIQPFVTVIDRADENEVARQYRRHDLLVFCSSYEGYGMVLAEAMAQGLAVISTPVGCATTLVVDGKTGLVVPRRDSRALADAIERLWGDVQLRVQLGNNASEQVRGLTWDKSARATVSQYWLALEFTRRERPAHSEAFRPS